MTLSGKAPLFAHQIPQNRNGSGSWNASALANTGDAARELAGCEKFFRADCPIDLGHIDLLPVLFHVYPFRGRLTFWKLPSVVRQKTRIVKNGDEIRQKENHFDP